MCFVFSWHLSQVGKPVLKNSGAFFLAAPLCTDIAPLNQESDGEWSNKSADQTKPVCIKHRSIMLSEGSSREKNHSAEAPVEVKCWWQSLLYKLSVSSWRRPAQFAATFPAADVLMSASLCPLSSLPVFLPLHFITYLLLWQLWIL